MMNQGPETPESHHRCGQNRTESQKKMLNSYKLETLEGQPLDGEYHARRLRDFVPRPGTELAAQQKEVEAKRLEEVNEAMEIEELENSPPAVRHDKETEEYEEGRRDKDSDWEPDEDRGQN